MIWNTDPVWISIRIGANIADRITSMSVETVRRIAPPLVLRTCVLMIARMNRIV